MIEMDEKGKIQNFFIDKSSVYIKVQTHNKTCGDMILNV